MTLFPGPRGQQGNVAARLRYPTPIRHSQERQALTARGSATWRGQLLRLVVGRVPVLNMGTLCASYLLGGTIWHPIRQRHLQEPRRRAKLVIGARRFDRVALHLKGNEVYPDQLLI